MRRSCKDVSLPDRPEGNQLIGACTQAIDDPTFGDAPAVTFIQHSFEFVPQQGQLPDTQIDGVEVPGGDLVGVFARSTGMCGQRE